ncbi:hypothetical protein HYH02_002027 [Chlamydomonas schloesseri]|uniref:Uncharacterized protein n=1 Tax=Chlamydomonas schloesseri TaxID=2026947 RepID=A0A835WU84_9CHLO|nr:hypothetical protein HYH02_002027 [Chlamydomonas schloesseri]|eukprot:KAG2453820.1 hypothetical protein HYH02_002027 [Chlamydomonas schloesseri]
MQLTSCLGGTSSRMFPRRAVAPATVRVPAPKMLGPHIPKLPSARGMRAACRAQFSDEVMLGALVVAARLCPTRPSTTQFHDCALVSWTQLLSSFTTSIKRDLDILKKDIKGDLDVLKKDIKGDLDVLKKDIKGDLDVLKKDIKADIKAADDRWAVAEARWYALAQRVPALEVAVTGELPVTKAPGDG